MQVMLTTMIAARGGRPVGWRLSDEARLRIAIEVVVVMVVIVILVGIN